MLIENLVKFKRDTAFRLDLTPKLCDEKLELKKGIPIKYSYVLLCLHIASKYSYFYKNEAEKFNPIKFESKEDYLEKYYVL